MRLLLDTHIFLWMISAEDRIGSLSRAALRNPENDRIVSAASVWEIAIKCASGRLDFPLEKLEAALAQIAATTLPITNAHALAAGALPRHHTDPFDRMLVSQARTDGLIVVTVDPALSRYDVPILNG